MAHNRTPMANVVDDDTFWNGTRRKARRTTHSLYQLGFRTVISEQPAPYDVESLERFIGESALVDAG